METQDKDIIFNGKELETQPELRAYIYQQINELSYFLTPDSKAGALIKVSDDRPSKYLVTLFLISGENQIEAIGQGSDVYEAVRLAKTLLLNQMTAIQDIVISTRERDLEITEALKSHQLH